MQSVRRLDGTRTKEIWIDYNEVFDIKNIKIESNLNFIKNENIEILKEEELSKEEINYFMQFSTLPIRKNGKYGLIITTPYKRIPEEIGFKFNNFSYLVNKKNVDNYIINDFIKKDFKLNEKDKNSRDFIIEMFTKMNKLGASDLNLSWTRKNVIITYSIDRKSFMEFEDYVSLEFGEKIKTTFVNMASENNSNGFIDGKFVLHVLGELKDCRLSVMKTGSGHAISIRTNKMFDLTKSLKDLGYTEKALEIIYDIITNNSYGMFLITGKTGSGKTTTLYTMLNELYKKYNYRIKTAENPIELDIDGIDQCEINLKGEEKNWVTYLTLLKGFLRQMPDIIAIGEIREKYVAMSAIEASLTGHNVVSTMHTGNVKSTFTRLIDTMNISKDRIEDSMSGILCQDLVPKLCSCKIKDEEHGGYKRNEEGCNECKGTGYDGRIPAVETASLKKSLENYKPENYRKFYSFKECADDLYEAGHIDYITKKYIYLKTEEE